MSITDNQQVKPSAARLRQDVLTDAQRRVFRAVADYCRSRQAVTNHNRTPRVRGKNPIGSYRHE